MNKKSFPSLLTGLALTLGAHAQSYDKLWQQADEAARKDLPQSALAFANQAYDKAVAEHNDAQLLRAVLMQRVLQGEVSPDSAEVCTQRMEAALEREQRPVVQALWHTALARIYADALSYDVDEDDVDEVAARDKAVAHARVALSQPALLADASATDYLPLFVQGDDSRYYHNDLLHVVYSNLAKETTLADSVTNALRPRLIELYKQRGNDNAVLLLTLEQLTDESHDDERTDAPLEQRTLYKQLLALSRQYEQLPLNVRTYIELTRLASDYDADDATTEAADSTLLALARRGVELYGKGKAKDEANALRNFIADKEAPSANVEHLAMTYLPGAKADISLKTRNTDEVHLRLTRLTDSYAEYDHWKDKEFAAALKRGRRQATDLTFTTARPDAWSWQRREEGFAVPETPGVYCAEILLNGKAVDHHVFSVTRIRPLTFATSESKDCRVTVVDAVTGQPVEGVTVKAINHEGRQIHAYTTDSKGQFTIPYSVTRGDEYYDVNYYASTTSDAASLPLSVNFGYYGWRSSSGESRAATTLNLFTDRAIYRPGQKVHFSGVAYTRHGDEFKVEKGLETKVTLYNTNHKAVDSLTVRTDEWGAFDGTFTLPEATLTGYFSLVAQGPAQRGSRYFLVEEYKRPTFTAETQPVTTSYSLGDTVEVEGVAKTYTGVPITGAKVAYTVRRSMWYGSARGEMPVTSTTVTDSEGRFKIPVTLWATADERRPDNSRYGGYYYEAQYTVTADNGETAQGSAILRAASWKALITLSDVPKVVAKEHLPKLTVKQVNAAGKELTVNGTYTLTSGGQARATGSFVTGQPLDTSTWPALPSGNYELCVRTNDEARPDTARFVLFSEADTRPADRENTLFAYSRRSEAGDEAVVRVGTKAPGAMLYYDLVACGRIVESRSVALSDSLLALDLHYKPEYGDGARAFFALVKDDKLYTFTTKVSKPEPDKRLMLRWTSFRSRLTPGSKEEWRLRVTYPDGRPAQAMVLARMYDASLDVFAKDTPQFSDVSFSRNLPYGAWSDNVPSYWDSILTATQRFKSLAEPAHSLTRWNESLFAYPSSRFYQRNEFAVLDATVAPQPRGSVALSRMAKVAEPQSAGNALQEVVVVSKKTQASVPNVTPRTNFAETAFFMPRLVTGADGEVTMAFTLPESTTTWNVNTLAHDREMNYGSADTTVVARKEFMVSPALPRFVRRGDRTVLPVKVTNLTAKEIKARLALTLTDALTEGAKPAYTKQQTITLAPGESKVYGFDYDATTAPSGMLICRTVAEGSGFSDGEEHYLPVIDNRVEVTRTLPFSLRRRGTTELRVDTLFDSPRATDRSFTVELSSSPLWYAVSALPSLAGDANCLSATEWATRYYALVLGLHVAEQNPEVRRLAGNDKELEALNELNLGGLTDATPWLQEALREKQRRAELRRLFDPEVSAARRYTAIDKLKMLQRSDGSWSWYPGMPGNTCITVDVAILLARLQKLAADKSADGLLFPAYAYLKRKMADEISKMKEYEQENKTRLRPTEVQMRYLYLRFLLGERPDADAKFLLDRAAERRLDFTMYGKALTAVVLAEAGREDEAKLNLQSLMEHTVATDEMGRYFDTPRAEWSWQSYRIPTQCAAIEALQYFGRKDEAADLRLWLLQAKRTQLWETSRATADAVYALLTAPADSSTIGSLSEGGQSLWFTLKRGKKIVGFNAPADTKTPTTVGYVRQTFTDPDATSATTVTLRKDRDGLSWGSVYATYTLPESDVKAAGKGLTVTQRLEVKRGTEWQAIAEGTVLAKGDRVRRVFTVTADRDYDFVCLDAQRAACLATAHPLSGYDYSMGLWAYRAVGDASTRYFIEQVRKGRHTMTEELFADRAGTYAMGLCKVQCVYAPEFTGTAAALTIKAE